MRALWPETVSGQGRSHLRDEGGLQVGYGSPEVLGSVCILPHLDPALRTRRRATLRVVEERAQGRVEREHTESVRKMKESLAVAPALQKAVYGKDLPIYVAVDTSPTRIG